MSSESLGDDLGHVAIRNEPAGFETGAYSRAERCAVLDFLTQGVADRDVLTGRHVSRPPYQASRSPRTKLSR